MNKVFGIAGSMAVVIVSVVGQILLQKGMSKGFALVSRISNK